MKVVKHFILYFFLAFVGISIYNEFTQSQNPGQSASAPAGSYTQDSAARDPDMIYPGQVFVIPTTN